MWRRRCCSYTVRAYDATGETLWVADYYQGATADSDPDIELSVAVIDPYVFVAGARMTLVAGGNYNCCRFDLTTGALISRHDLWTTSASRNLLNGNGDIIDVCAGADGNLGVLWWNTHGGGGNSQHMGSYAPAMMANNWYVSSVNHTITFPPFNVCEMDSTGKMHVGGERSAFGTGTGRSRFAIDGSSEYICGGHMETGLWYAETGFVCKAPGLNLPGLAAYQTYGGSVGWATQLTEAFLSTTTYRAEWHSLATRWNGLTAGGGSGLDTANDLGDIAVLRDGGGAALGLVTVGSGMKRGATASADIFGGAGTCLATAGSLSESGCVGRWSLAGVFTKTYSPDARTAIGRVATVPGAGYVLGAGRLLSLPTLYMRDSADMHLWAHKHQDLSDLVTTPAGGCVTVGGRSHRTDTEESSFVTP